MIETRVIFLLMKSIPSFLLIMLACSSFLRADILLTYDFNGTLAGEVAPAFTGKLTAADYDVRADQHDAGVTGLSGANFNVFMRATGTTTDSTIFSGTEAYHTFGLTVNGLAANERLDLTSISFGYQVSGTISQTAFFWSLFSDAVGTAYDLDERLGNASFFVSGSDPSPVVVSSVDLTSSNTVAGSSFTGLSNGTTIQFLIGFGDDGTNDGNADAIHRVGVFGGNGQAIQIEGNISVIPEPSTLFLVLTAGVVSLGLLRRRRQ